MSQEEILKDIEELNRLRQLATRPRIKDFLANEVSRLQSVLVEVTCDTGGVGDEVHNERVTDTNSSTDNSATSPVSDVSGQQAEPVKMEASNTAANQCISVSKAAPVRYYKDITTYAWDQSEKFMKIYVTLAGVQKLDKNSVKSEYSSNSFQLKVENLDGLNYTCHVRGLWGRLLPEQCYHKVKSDTVLLMLRKEEEKKTWPYLTEQEDKKKPAPKFDDKKDPSEGLMDLLKKMYAEGDDEMKQTIAKSWCESRNKTSTMDL